jgi:HK97 family phage major capsid protein
LILTPVLYGELFPFVDVRTIARGRRVKGGTVTNPEFTSGTGEGTAITPFNTASFVGAFDTAIFPAVAAIELGQDFEEDTPVDLGGQIVEQFGLKAMEWLDRVVAVGNGYDEPQGLFNATAASLLTSVYGASGPATVSDAEALMFGLAKQFRTEGNKFLAYVSNDYTYRKFRSLPVGPGDERRVYGMDHAEYKLNGYDHKIQNNIPDGYIAYANLRKYVMYRRLGMQVRVETGGRQLALSNTRLIVVRMRYGGQLSIGGAAALMKDIQVV